MKTNWKVMTPVEKKEALSALREMKRVRKVIKKRLDEEFLKKWYKVEFDNIVISPYQSTIGIYHPGKKVRRKINGHIREFIEIDVFLVELGTEETIIYETTRLLKDIENGSIIKDPLYYD